ncbi:MAG TPA: NADH-quinone oxidoreductase subunit L, partial [Candidatus Limnocylindrales bacterium]|nr:NADH-quinone oxidoreductase subunit L [Candidatus Limnocylindrales bacterium]
MTDPAFPALAALLLPACAFVILGVVAPLRRLGRPAAYLSIVFSAIALVAAIGALRLAASGGYSERVWTWIPAEAGPLATVGVLADGDSALMLVLVALVSFLVQVYSLGYLSGEAMPSLGRYYAYQSLFAFSMMGLVLAPNFVQLFICWELVGLCSYLLIGYWYTKPEAARAAVKAFWITKVGDVGLLIGIVLLWRQTGTFDFLELLMLADAGVIPLAGLGVITFCIYLGAAGKSAQFPFHVWLPDAMEGPTPVSALIHAATMVTAGVYLLTRTVWLFRLTPEVMEVVAWNGAFTALLAAVLACVQSDIKRVLAYSTVSQLGYMMAAIGAGFASAGFLHLLTHGIFKALLFLGAGAVIHAVGTNDIFEMGRLWGMGGLRRRMPQTAIVFVIGTLSLAGVPLFAGFFSKEEILGAVLAGGFPVPFAMLLLGAFLTAFYMFRVVFVTFAGAPAASPAVSQAGHHGADSHVHDAPPFMALPLWVLAIMCVGVGTLFAVWHPEAEFEAPGWLTAAAFGIALAGIALAYLVYQRHAISADGLASAFAPIRAAALRRFWIDDAF